jgi:hypothetical protein
LWKISPVLNAFDFDLVWLQNQVSPLMQYDATQGMAQRTLFVFVHLSSATPLETPGIVFEPLLADFIFSNSAETRAHLVNLGVPDGDILIYPNPAPEMFWTNEKPSHRQN